MLAYNPRRAAYGFFSLLLLTFCLAGCAGLRVADQVERNLAAGDYAAGLSAIEKEKAQYAGPNSLLYYLDVGSLEQRAGEYSRSSQELEQAELLIDQLYTKSISESAASFLVNDMTLSYSGEDYEQVMVNVLKALNYLYLGDGQGSQVEARKVNTRLLALADKYGQEAVYKQDAFARYLSAFAYEADGDYNSAYIDYKKAYEAFGWYMKYYGLPVPRIIREDLLRLSRWLGFDDEYERWRRQFGPDLPDPVRRPVKRSEVLLVVYDGLIPRKHTRYATVPIQDSEGEPYILKVAFPVMKPRLPAIGNVRLGLPDGTVAESEIVEPLNDIAIQNLEQRIGLISAKAIARATAKYLAADQLRRATRSGNTGANLLMNLATNVYTAVSEQADTRSWRTLPNRFHIIRATLAPGKYRLDAAVTGIRGETRPSLVLDVDLKAGEKKVVPLYLER